MTKDEFIWWLKGFLEEKDWLDTKDVSVIVEKLNEIKQSHYTRHIEHDGRGPG